MSPTKFVASALALGLCLLPVAGCGGAEGHVEPSFFTTIENESKALETERKAAAALASQLATARAARRDTADLERRLAGKKAEIARLAGQLDQHLVDYLNSSRPLPGTDVTPEVRRVLDLKVAEDLVAAQEFIDEGGDYAHAIQIYNDLLRLDPGNPRVQAALADAQENRTLSSERFAALRKGMTRDQVRTTLGMPHLKNIQAFEEQGVVAWFYPTAEGGTAGVYFQAEGEGEPVVYRWDFAALPPSPETGAARAATGQ